MSDVSDHCDGCNNADLPYKCPGLVDGEGLPHKPASEWYRQGWQSGRAAVDTLPVIFVKGEAYVSRTDLRAVLGRPDPDE